MGGPFLQAGGAVFLGGIGDPRDLMFDKFRKLFRRWGVAFLGGVGGG